MLHYVILFEYKWVINSTPLSFEGNLASLGHHRINISQLVNVKWEKISKRIVQNIVEIVAKIV